MTRLSWDDRHYEFGIDRGVLYPQGGSGVVWNGLISIKESESDVTEQAYYVDALRYLADQDSGSFSAAVTAYIYPDDIDHVDSFGFSYRTRIGDSEDYILHIVYNAFFKVNEKNYNSINQSVDILQFDLDLTTVPIYIPGHKPSAHLIVDSRKVYPWVLSDLEDILYGMEDSDPELPPLDNLLNIFEEGSILKITDHGDGTWTAEGPDDVVYLTDDTEFEISWPSAIFLDSISYKVSSL